MMDEKGLIYALINYSMPGLVKVGMTTKTAEERASELSSVTGVATPFVVAFEVPVPNVRVAERSVHERLSALGYRVTGAREFFNAPLKVVIGVMMQVGFGLGTPLRLEDAPPATTFGEDFQKAVTEAFGTTPVRGEVHPEIPLEMFLRAAYVVVTVGTGSVQILRARLGIGHREAKILMSLLERYGVQNSSEDLTPALISSLAPLPGRLRRADANLFRSLFDER